MSQIEGPEPGRGGARESSTRENIMVAAELALLEGGPGELRVDRVAAQAGANKRMIYHYFGDRNGLVDAVYRLQLDRLQGAGDALSAGTYATLALLLGSPETRSDVVGVTIDPLQLQRAAQIVLPQLMQVRGAGGVTRASEASPRQWISFCVEMMSLAFADSAPVDFPHPPGSREFSRVSERLLSGEKHRYRVHGDSRAVHHGTVHHSSDQPG